MRSRPTCSTIVFETVVLPEPLPPATPIMRGRRMARSLLADDGPPATDHRHIRLCSAACEIYHMLLDHNFTVLL